MFNIIILLPKRNYTFLSTFTSENIFCILIYVASVFFYVKYIYSILYYKYHNDNNYASNICVFEILDCRICLSRKGSIFINQPCIFLIDKLIKYIIYIQIDK